MSDIVLISGSPSATSRSSALLKDLAVRFSQLGVESTFIAVRDLPPEDLIWARYDSAALKPSIDLVSRARVVTGGSPAHLLAIDYSLKPVLSALGATELLQGIYAVDDQVKVNPAGGLTLHEDIEKRMTASATLLVTAIKARGLAAIG
jgi:FMN reductase